MGILEKSAVFLVITALVVAPLILGIFLRDVPLGFQPPLDKVIDLNYKNAVSQTFTASDNNLSIIGVSIKNPNLLNKEDLNFSIYSDGQPIRTIVLSGKNIQDGDFMKIRFNPIPDSLGKTYQMKFFAPTVSENPLQLFVSNQPKPAETLMVNNKPFAGSIAYVPFYKASNPVSETLKIYSGLFSQLGKDLGFALFYGLLLLCGLAFLVI